MQVSAACHRDPAPLQFALREAYRPRLLDQPTTSFSPLRKRPRSSNLPTQINSTGLSPEGPYFSCPHISHA